MITCIIALQKKPINIDLHLCCLYALFNINCVIMSDQVRVYLRNSQKIAKVLFLPPSAPYATLLSLTSSSFSLPQPHIHLYYQGDLLSPSSLFTLENNTIVHLVNTLNLRQQRLTVIVKRLNDERGQACDEVVFYVEKNMNIGEFVEEEVFGAFGVGKEEVMLVHLGRELDFGKSFGEEEVEHQSQIICVNKEENEENGDREVLQQQGEAQEESEEARYEDQEPVLRAPLPSPDCSFTARNKQVYPSPNFTIDVPRQLNSKNTLNLIFDSKIRKSSSIQGLDFEPEECIRQQQQEIDSNANSSLKSEPNPFGERNKIKDESQDNNSVVQEYAEEGHRKEDRRGRGQERGEGTDRKEKKGQIQGGKFIYEKQNNRNGSKVVMKNLIDEMRNKLTGKTAKNKQK